MQQRHHQALAMEDAASPRITTAFTPFFNPSSKNRRAPIPISDELGTSPTFGYRFFDPLDLADEDNFARNREAELKHGRIAMLAVVGNVVPDLQRMGGLQDSINVMSPVPESQLPLLLSFSRNLAFQDIPCGLGALSKVPWEGWLQILLLVGLLETRLLVQRSRKDMPGDYGIGYFGLRDKGLHERSLKSELENGRLAMIAFSIQILIELITGQTPGDMIRSML